MTGWEHNAIYQTQLKLMINGEDRKEFFFEGGGGGLSEPGLDVYIPSLITLQK